MNHSDIYSAAFAELSAQKFTIRRTTLDARVENSKKPTSNWEKQTSQKLLDMFSDGKTKYRHLIFDTADSVYAWNGCGFIPVDVVKEGLFFHDEWSEYACTPSDAIRSASDLLCWHLDQFDRQLSPTKRLKSLWNIGTEDTLPVDEAVQLAMRRGYDITMETGIPLLSFEHYSRQNQQMRDYLLTRGQYECSNVLRHAVVKLDTK